MRTWLSEIINLRNMFKRLRIRESENLTIYIYSDLEDST